MTDESVRLVIDVEPARVLLGPVHDALTRQHLRRRSPSTMSNLLTMSRARRRCSSRHRRREIAAARADAADAAVGSSEQRARHCSGWAMSRCSSRLLRAELARRLVDIDTTLRWVVVPTARRIVVWARHARSRALAEVCGARPEAAARRRAERRERDVTHAHRPRRAAAVRYLAQDRRPRSRNPAAGVEPALCRSRAPH